MSVKIYTSGNIYSILQWKLSFLKIKSLKGWDAAACFRNMLILTAGTALDNWNSIIGSVQNIQWNEATFDVYLNQFITAPFPTDPRGYLDDQLAKFKLKGNESVKQFNIRFQKHAEYVTLLPAENDPYSTRELMKIYKATMPEYWVTLYEVNTVKCTTITQLMDYFSSLDENKTPKTDPNIQPKFYKKKNSPQRYNPFHNNHNHSNHKKFFKKSTY